MITIKKKKSFFFDRINKIYWIFILIIQFILSENEDLD